MIKSIHGGGDYLMVSGGSSVGQYFNNYAGALNVGQLRYNPNNQNLEVYDGNGWVMMNTNHVNIDLTTRAKDILNWAEYQMVQERELRALMDRHPGLKDLHDKFEMMKLLCQEEEKEK
jgi:hypothetical protein